MTAVVYEIWRDEQAHSRALELQHKEQDFVFGTASHMAEVVYDKHVDFCEEYIARLQVALQELLREGLTREALNIGRELVNIRQKHSAWLTNDIETQLQPIEQALIKIGAREPHINKIKGGSQREEEITEVYKVFGLILGHEKPENPEEAQVALTATIDKIRDILGIKIMTEIRLKTSELALRRIKDLE